MLDMYKLNIFEITLVNKILNPILHEYSPVFDRKKVTTSGHAVYENHSHNLSDIQYQDLQVDQRNAADYTQLQTRNDDYSDVESTGHAFIICFPVVYREISVK